MIVKFGDDTDGVTLGAILSGVTGWTIEIEYEEGVEGFPTRCAIDRTTRDSLVLCDVNETGAPKKSPGDPIYRLDYDEIKSITIL
jgi:hypothetical protein